MHTLTEYFEGFTEEEIFEQFPNDYQIIYRILNWHNLSEEELLNRILIELGSEGIKEKVLRKIELELDYEEEEAMEYEEIMEERRQGIN